MGFLGIYSNNKKPSLHMMKEWNMKSREKGREKYITLEERVEDRKIMSVVSRNETT